MVYRIEGGRKANEADYLWLLVVVTDFENVPGIDDMVDTVSAL